MFSNQFFLLNIFPFEIDIGSPNNITVRNVAINPQNKFDEICGYALHPSGFIPDPNLHTGFLIVTFPPPAQPGDYHLLDTGSKI